MKRNVLKKIILLTALMTAFFISCSNPSDDEVVSDSNDTTVTIVTEEGKYWYPVYRNVLWTNGSIGETKSYGEALQYYGVSELTEYNAGFTYAIKWGDNVNDWVAPGHVVTEYPSVAVVYVSSENKLWLRWIEFDRYTYICEGLFEYR